MDYLLESDVTKVHHRGEAGRSVLVGSSVHNQRIERLWRDSHRCVTSVYYRLFYFLEETDLLDPINDQHLFALHCFFFAENKQQDHLEWHGMIMGCVRTERNQTPRQIFKAGALRLRHSGSPAFGLL